MKWILTLALCICINAIACSLVELQAAEKETATGMKEAPARDPGRPGFSVGIQCHYTILDPVWSSMDFNATPSLLLLFRSAFVPMRYADGRAFTYNPVFSIRMNDRFSLSGSYLYGSFFWKSLNAGVSSANNGIVSPAVWKQRFSVTKHDAELLLNVTLARWLKVFLGPKYQAYLITEDNKAFNINIFGNQSFPLFPVTNIISFHSIGLGAGLGFNVQVYSGLYFLANLSAIALFGKDYAAGSGTIGNQSSQLYGGIGSAAFAYYIEVIRITLSAGFKAQYLAYTNAPRSVYKQGYDLNYGPFCGAVFSY